jgi:hypothetical protein
MMDSDNYSSCRRQAAELPQVVRQRSMIFAAIALQARVKGICGENHVRGRMGREIVASGEE